MIWENWLVAISIGLIAVAFVVLVVFVILALVSMRKTVDDVEHKLHSLDPLFRVVSRAGNVMEKQAEKKLADVEAEIRAESLQTRTGTTTAMEVAEWALIGLALWQKIKERRR